MRTIIAGSRDLSYSDVLDAMREVPWRPTVVISGTARGVDESGEIWAAHNHVPVECFPADWKGLGRRAGYVRNEQMAAAAEALIAVWDGRSPGTKNMIEIAVRKKLRVFIWTV